MNSETFNGRDDSMIRGSNIKYLCVSDEVVGQVKEDQNRTREANRGSRGKNQQGMFVCILRMLMAILI